MHPLAIGLSRTGLTQQQLADRVNRLRRRRPSGKLLRITQGFISAVILGDKRLSVPMAKAVAEALDGFVNAADLLLYEPPKKATRKAS